MGFDQDLFRRGRKLFFNAKMVEQFNATVPSKIVFDLQSIIKWQNKGSVDVNKVKRSNNDVVGNPFGDEEDKFFMEDIKSLLQRWLPYSSVRIVPGAQLEGITFRRLLLYRISISFRVKFLIFEKKLKLVFLSGLAESFYGRCLNSEKEKNNQ